MGLTPSIRGKVEGARRCSQLHAYGAFGTARCHPEAAGAVGGTAEGVADVVGVVRRFTRIACAAVMALVLLGDNTSARVSRLG